jgi:hypothetical protein
MSRRTRRVSIVSLEPLEPRQLSSGTVVSAAPAAGSPVRFHVFPVKAWSHRSFDGVIGVIPRKAAAALGAVRATVAWGDGTEEEAVVVSDGGRLVVRGAHTWASSGKYQVSVHVETEGGGKTEATTIARVGSADARGPVWAVAAPPAWTFPRFSDVNPHYPYTPFILPQARAGVVVRELKKALLLTAATPDAAPIDLSDFHAGDVFVQTFPIDFAVKSLATLPADYQGTIVLPADFPETVSLPSLPGAIFLRGAGWTPWGGESHLMTRFSTPEI